MRIGGPEILLLLALALIFIGPNRIPDFARSLGKATTEYKKGLNEAKKLITSDTESSHSPEEMEIIRAAKSLGIPVENRSVEEIADDLLAASD